MITAPSVSLILNDCHSQDRLYTTLLVYIYEIGEALRPLVIAPLSEAYGRLPVWHVTYLLFIYYVMGCAKSTDLGMLIYSTFYPVVHLRRQLLGQVSLLMYSRQRKGAWPCL